MIKVRADAHASASASATSVTSSRLLGDSVIEEMETWPGPKELRRGPSCSSPVDIPAFACRYCALVDAATAVALVLGGAGFVWGGITFFLNRGDTRTRDAAQRADELERRWLQEKRAVYVRAQHAFVAFMDPVIVYSNSRALNERMTNEDVELWHGAFGEIRQVSAELALIAPQPVRDAYDDAVTAMLDLAHAYERTAGEAPGTAQSRAHNRALNAMRVDLGVPPIPWVPAVPGRGSA